MKISKRQAIKIIVESAKSFENKLQNKHFLIIYQERGQLKSVEVGFRDNHFLHMTGIETRLTAKRFFEKCITKNIIKQVHLW